eukprot:Skav224086  [mRNA]  locus=scaffold942:423567:424004:+ [translate_table: standard]
MALRKLRTCTFSLLLLWAHLAFIGPVHRRALLSIGGTLLAADGAQALPGSPRFAGKYDDPDFPGCPREIVPQGARVLVRGADGPSCTDGSWEVLGRRGRGAPDTVDGNQLSLDFSPRGGPKDVIATWRENQLLFPDGKIWTRRTR